MSSLTLSDFDHLRTDKRCKFKEEFLGGELVTIIAYMISDPEYWKIPLSTETRGIVFNSRGECISRPFEKFWNIGENPQTQESVLPWDRGFIVEEKVDGSMVTPVLLSDGSIRFKTKKTFFNEIAASAQRVFENLPAITQQKIRWALQMGITPIFEYTGPDNKIVLNYPEKLWLLAARANSTGEYVSPDRHNLPGLEFPKEYTSDKDEIISLIKESRGMEGVVIRFDSPVNENGFYDSTLRVKLKTPWYISLHRVLTDIRERDIAEAVVNETYDDIYAVIATESPDLLPKITDIQRMVFRWIFETHRIVDDCVSMARPETTPKEIAALFKEHPLFDLIIAEFRGKDIEGLVKKKFIRDELPKYSLRSIGGHWNSDE